MFGVRGRRGLGEMVGCEGEEMMSKRLHPSVARLLGNEAATVGDLITRLQRLPIDARVGITYEGTVSPAIVDAIRLESIAGSNVVIFDAEQ
jgi:hypothetical protein